MRSKAMLLQIMPRYGLVVVNCLELRVGGILKVLGHFSSTVGVATFLHAQKNNLVL